MKVLYFKVGEVPSVIEVDESLESLQDLVGGYLEVVKIPSFSKVILVCNEEGRLLSLQPNKILKSIRETIYGDFFICEYDGEEMCSISSEMTNDLSNLFASVKEGI